jgi:amino acid permease
MFNASACGLQFSIIMRWEVLNPIVNWQAIGGVIEHGLESYMVRLMGEAEFIWTGIRH